MSPTTLPALRAAVARVLAARGEPADALVCDVYRLWRRPGWGASIGAATCGVVVDWLVIGGATRAEAVAAMWRRFVWELAAEFVSARHASAATRRPERRAPAEVRLCRAAAALAAARGVGDGG